MIPKYTCLDCGQTFDKPQKYTEPHGLETPPYETFMGCPFCGGDYERTIVCDGCGKPITGEYVEILTSGENFCESCYWRRTIGD